MKNNQQNTNNGFGIAGMIIGICALLSACIFIGGFLGVIGLILSIVALTQRGKKKGTAIAGTILNTVSILIMLVMIATSVSFSPDTQQNETGVPSQEIEYVEPKDDGYATLDKFNQIETGMTYEEVVDIMGSEGTVMSESEIMDIKTTMYYWYAKNGVSNMNITVQNDEVVSKAQLGLK